MSSLALDLQQVFACHVAAGFMQRSTFCQLRECSLAVGDSWWILAKFKSFEGNVADSATLKIRKLLQVGYLAGKLEQRVALLGGVPWTTVDVEEAQCSTDLLHRFHTLLLRRRLGIQNNAPAVPPLLHFFSGRAIALAPADPT